MRSVSSSSAIVRLFKNIAFTVIIWVGLPLTTGSAFQKYCIHSDYLSWITIDHRQCFSKILHSQWLSELDYHWPPAVLFKNIAFTVIIWVGLPLTTGSDYLRWITIDHRQCFSKILHSQWLSELDYHWPPAVLFKNIAFTVIIWVGLPLTTGR